MFSLPTGNNKQKLSGIVQHSHGLAFATISQQSSQKPLLKSCLFQPQISDYKTTLNQLVQKTGNRKIPLTTLLDPKNFTLLLMQRPTVEEEELNDAIRWQIKDQLDFPADEAIIQTLDIPGQEERGRLPMIYAIAAHETAIKSSIALLEDNKFNLQYIDIPELAQRNISALLPEDFIGVAVLNLQADYGLLTITHEGELYLSRRIDVGYEDMEIVQEEPQELSLEVQYAGSEPAIDKIVLEIQRSLDYYESHYGKPSIGNLIIAPLESDIPSLNSQLENNLGVTVRSLDITEILDSKDDLPLGLQAQCFNAIGAALRHAVESLADSKPE